MFLENLIIMSVMIIGAFLFVYKTHYELRFKGNRKAVIKHFSVCVICLVVGTVMAYRNDKEFAANPQQQAKNSDKK